MLKHTVIAAAAASALLLAGCASQAPAPAPAPAAAAQPPVDANAWTARLATLKASLEAATQGTGVVIEQTTDNQLHVVMPADRSFDVGRATLRRDLSEMLDKIAEGLRSATRASILIVGHTDATGGDSANEKLSLARADNARSLLVSRGVLGSIVKAEGHGEREPIADNHTAAGRAQNRRVEIYISEKG
ncbi:MAG: OmpA family protein [Proteobacteria bacterium]|nr:OmpA family protein [Pseudomonadota bacterium]